MTTSAPDSAPAPAAAVRRPGLLEILVALACFAILCGAALARPVKLLEPDDYAYRASIVALTEGHVRLTDAQYRGLAARLMEEDAAAGLRGSRGIAQWTQLAGGSWISEKNPGYPFLAAPFEAAGLVPPAPLFYGALGCLALFAGGRRWLGAWGGTFAVGLFCSSGAALAFAWRAWMPTFTGAALIAAGAGALLWAVLARDAGARWRMVAGLLGFFALEAAMLLRYTDAIAVAVAVVAVLAVWHFAPGSLPRRALWWWIGSVALAGMLVLAWNARMYGSAAATGYASGVVSFGLGAIRGNLDHMPRLLVQTIPASLLALASLVWMIVRSLWLRRTAPESEARPSRAAAHRDLAVAAALAAAWWGAWGLYFTYYWTATGGGPGGAGGPMGAATPGGMGPLGGAGPAGAGNAVHLVRFFVPALAPIALLGAWALVRLPRWLGLAAVAAFFGLGLWSYADMTAADARGGIMGGMPGGPEGFPGGVPPGGSGGVPPVMPEGTPPSGSPLPSP
jgi:hypothetical protein